DLDARGTELPLGMPGPVVRGRVGGTFEPPLGREDIDPAVAVDVARADAVAGGRRAQVVLLPDGINSRPGELVPDDDVGGVRQDVEPAVAVYVDHRRRLARAGQVDLMIGPVLARRAGVL